MNSARPILVTNFTASEILPWSLTKYCAADLVVMLLAVIFVSAFNQNARKAKQCPAMWTIGSLLPKQ